MVKQMLSIGQSRKSITLRPYKLPCNPALWNKTASYLMVQIELLGYIQKSPRHGRQWIAIGCNQPHGMGDVWFREIQCEQSIHFSKKRKKGVRYDSRPVPEVHMGPQGDQRVCLNGGMHLCTGFVKVHVEDAAILHIGGEQAERISRGFQPRNRRAALQLATGLPREKNIPLHI